jgi:nicotinate-nucleotide adenylyltransferase
MGGDNIEILHKWHKGEDIARKYKIIVYPREGADIEDLCKKYGAVCIDAPQINVSSSQIRQMQQEGEDVSSLRY